MYEVNDLAVLSSPDYLARLNDPTPWTQRTIGSFRNGFRSACRVAYSEGAAEAGYLLALRFRPADPDTARACLIETLLPGLADRPGVTRVCFALPDRSSSTLDTAESRESGNVFIDEWLLLVEGIGKRTLVELSDDVLSADRFDPCGVAGPVNRGIYQLQARVERGSVRPERPAPVSPRPSAAPYGDGQMSAV